MYVQKRILQGVRFNVFAFQDIDKEVPYCCTFKEILLRNHQNKIHRPEVSKIRIFICSLFHPINQKFQFSFT